MPHPIRTTVVSGSRSGMGKAVTALLRERGERVIGIDLADVEIIADLATSEGRARAVSEVRRLCPAGVDAHIGSAGLANANGRDVVSVNFFGATALAEALLPMLTRGAAPRAVIICSLAAVHPRDDALVELCLAGAETQAVERARNNPAAYASSKNALVRWIRRNAPREDWAGAGVLLNGISPGLIRTPMTADMLATEEGRARLAEATPLAVADSAVADDVAPLLAFLAGPDNRYMVGQVPFYDGGADVILRGDVRF